MIAVVFGPDNVALQAKIPFLLRVLELGDSHILPIVAENKEAAAEIAAPMLPTDHRALWIAVSMPDREWPMSFWLHGIMWGKDSTPESRKLVLGALECLRILGAPFVCEECGDTVTIQIDTDDPVLATKLHLCLPHGYQYTKRVPDWA